MHILTGSWPNVHCNINLFITSSHIPLNFSNKFMFGLSFSQRMLHVYLITYVVKVLLKMVQAALSEVCREIEWKTVHSAINGRKVFEGEFREVRIKKWETVNRYIFGKSLFHKKLVLHGHVFMQARITTLKNVYMNISWSVCENCGHVWRVREISQPFQALYCTAS